jgi:exodeoxyribonuclease III
MQNTTTKTLIAMLAIASTFASPASATELKLFTWNTHGLGATDKKPIDETVAVYKAVGADIIGVQETVPEPDPCGYGTGNCVAGDQTRTAEVAKALGLNFHEFKHNTENHWADAVLTKYEIGKETPNGAGVELNVEGKKVVVYSMNLNDYPYVPYQLTNIKYGEAPFIKTADEAMKYAKQAHGKALELLLADIESEKDAAAQIIMSDLNEPSHLDWTDKAVAAGLQPIVMKWPFTSALEAKGFVDSFRSIYPDVVAKPGMTWTPKSDPKATDDHHDRIDVLLVKGMTVKSAGIVGEKAPEADVVVTPWPSDHRGSMAVVELK